MVGRVMAARATVAGADHGMVVSCNGKASAKEVMAGGVTDDGNVGVTTGVVGICNGTTCLASEPQTGEMAPVSACWAWVVAKAKRRCTTGRSRGPGGSPGLKPWSEATKPLRGWNDCRGSSGRDGIVLPSRKVGVASWAAWVRRSVTKDGSIDGSVGAVGMDGVICPVQSAAGAERVLVGSGAETNGVETGSMRIGRADGEVDAVVLSDWRRMGCSGCQVAWRRRSRVKLESG